jgi:phage tail-like protein
MPRQDPLRNYIFRVEIDGVAEAGFSEVSIGATTIDVIEYREGSDPAHVRKLPGLTRFGNITLKRGMTQSRDLSEWFQQISAGQIAGNRRSVSIVLLDENAHDAARFVVTQAWPIKYVASDLSAKGNDVEIETLELVNEGIERVA